MIERRIGVEYEFVDDSVVAPKESKDWAKIDKGVMDIVKAMQEIGLKRIEIKASGGDQASEAKKS